MIVQMDKVYAAPSRERSQRLYEKNIELEKKRRKSIQARVPSDPNAWQQMRENYEAIILDDHSFAEQLNIEYALWQLHYRRIEELRSHFQSALSSTSTGSNASQGVKVPGRPERITKIRQQFKTFLSEAAGFYHDLIQKIKAKYGLPLGYFSENSDSRAIKEKDGKKPVEAKKGVISCHRCLIYLGDLARYKGLYGDEDSKTREYSTASSYYMQAASLWPSSGNPHHQLAILASYSGDELVAVYRYFRSLAAEHPFVTARDNLIVAFEKNRQSFSELLGDVKLSLVKDSLASLNGKGRGRSEVKHASKTTNSGASVEDKTYNTQELEKSFCIRFVRLNGILFTRTSLETFPEVLASVSQAFGELLSSGEERLPFGGDAADNGLFLVRLIATLIFTIHNVKKEADGQSYAAIVQRAVLLQNALTAAFEIMGHILQRVAQLPDPSSSSLLPAILVCLEWLACYPDVASGIDVDEKQGVARVNFCTHCIMFLNTILPFSSMSSDNKEDERCFYNMTPYEEGETENRLALWEDYELRGFLPLFPTHTILDFSRSDGKKEKSARIKRILAAGKALVNLVKVDQKAIHFDSRMKKFTMGVEPQVLENGMIPDANVSMPKALNQETSDRAQNLGVVEPHPQVYIDGEEEDEVIVFKPLASEKSTNTPQSPKLVQYDNLRASKNTSVDDLQLYTNNASAPLDQLQKQLAFGATAQLTMSNENIIHQQAQPLSSHTSKWLAEEAASLANSLKAVRFVDNGHMMEQGVQKDMAFTQPIIRPASVEPYNANSIGMFYGLSKVPEPMVPSQINIVASAGALSESLAVKTSAPLQTGMRKSPVSRPVRHLGPPPGFSHVPPKQVVEPISSSGPRTNILSVADYSRLDGYPLPPSTTASGLNNSNNLTLYATQQFMHNNGFVGTGSFPFPGKQGPPVHVQAESMKGWQNYQALEHIRAQEQQLQQQFRNGNQQSTPTPEQYHGQSMWGGRDIV